jgi:hypothetical protein
MNMKGFTLFFALLASSLALSIGLAILDITLRELQLSSTVAQSEYAIYAADTGVECALYWDDKYGGSGSAFATSTQSNPPASGIWCNNQDVAADGTPPSPFGIPPSGWKAWGVNEAASAATTTFTVSFLPSETYCVTVTVAKVGNPPATTIDANGFNTCQGGDLQLERTLQVSY